MGCCTSLLYGTMVGASKNVVKIALTSAIGTALRAAPQVQLIFPHSRVRTVIPARTAAPTTGLYTHR
jgi:hypothetical protein